MSFEWNFNLQVKLEAVLLGLIGGKPKHLYQIASDLGVQLNTRSDKSRLKYRIRKIVDNHPDLQYFGYTKNGYVVAKYVDEFSEIVKHLRRIGDGMINKAKKYAVAAKNQGILRNSEQMTLFDDLFDVENW